MLSYWRMPEMTAADLLKAIESNDRGFVAELESIIGAIVRRWNWSDAERVEDMAQDCFLKLLQNLRADKFKGESSLKTYIYAIARNTCLDYYKERKALDATEMESVLLVDESLSAEERLIDRDQRRLARQVLLHMPDECRRLWRTIFFGKRNYKQAGELLGLSEGTVKRRMWECRQMAREKLISLEN